MEHEDSSQWLEFKRGNQVILKTKIKTSFMREKFFSTYELSDEYIANMSSDDTPLKLKHRQKSANEIKSTRGSSFDHSYTFDLKDSKKLSLIDLELNL